MNLIATPKSKFEKAVKKCAVSPLKINFIQFGIIQFVPPLQPVLSDCTAAQVENGGNERAKSETARDNDARAWQQKPAAQSNRKRSKFFGFSGKP